jgi:hypothetical protein
MLVCVYFACFAQIDLMRDIQELVADRNAQLVTDIQRMIGSGGGSGGTATASAT